MVDTHSPLANQNGIYSSKGKLSGFSQKKKNFHNKSKGIGKFCFMFPPK